VNAGVYLQSYLAPLAPWLEAPDITDILINRPGEIWIERQGGAMERLAVPELSERVLGRLIRQVAAASDQGINREQPLLSATLPDGARVQVVGPPATREGTAIAIRKHALADLSIGRLDQDGFFAPAADDSGAGEERLDRALLAGDYAVALVEAVWLKKTMVISGGTSSGKTTLLNALLKEVPVEERLIVIEDAPELKLDRPNAIGLIGVRGELGESQVDAEMLLQAALRMRPDRILLGELRGAEAFTFLRAINTGHPGSITTIHADSAEGALNQIVMLALLNGANLQWDALRRYAEQVIDLVVHIERRAGSRHVTEVRRISPSGNPAAG
jgi:type IV secretion system protein VirB11